MVERRADRRRDRHHVLDRQLLASIVELREHAAEILAVHVLHREEVPTAVLPDVVHLHDVVVVERARESRLGDEHLDERGVARLLRAQVLDHDVAFEVLDAGRSRHRQIGHASPREVLDHLVPPQLGARRQTRHVPTVANAGWKVAALWCRSLCATC
jgi:hypothetical protein